MKSKSFPAAVVLLLCSSYGMAQVADDPPQTRPMTRYEKAIAKIDNMNDLKTAYDTLKSDYDRRYFVHALPGYFADHGIKTVPAWVTEAVLSGVRSNDPRYIREAVQAADGLGINCSGELMALYPAIRTTFGSHEDMLKSTLLAALRRMENPEKKRFIYDILTRDGVPAGSATFSALLDAILAEPDRMYAQKLGEYASTLAARIAQLSAETDTQKRYYLPRLKEIKDKVDRATSRLATGGGQ